ncbi:MAG TPA: FHA domain-containing protein [Armatimonadota bacterium]|nr:FHA domain-containing protein [Armatimonadota bacterium]
MSEVVFVKYCPLCGAENPRQQAFCLQCLDGDLSTVPVEPRRTEVPVQTDEPICVLELVENPAVRFSVRDGQTVGRTEKADIVLRDVPKLDWISGEHAKFTRQGERWYVQHVGKTNFIKVDGEKFEGPEEVAIYDGSILVLSLTGFRISIKEG